MSSTAIYNANVSISGTLYILSSNLQANIVSGNVSTSYTQYVKAAALAISPSHTAILMSDGTVRTCGNNGNGQLGDGTTSTRSTVVQVLSVSTATAVACGSGYTVILLSDGTVRTIGFNSSGQLGDGTTTNRTTLVQVSGISTAVAVACGGSHTAILLSDGTVRTCGNNGNGQLGDNTTSNRSTTVAVSGVSTAIAVAGGLFHTAILLSNGTVRTCGNNNQGQLGDNTTSTNRLTVVTVTGVSTAIAVACGNYHTAIVLSDGTIRAVGLNASGQLGDNTTSTRSTTVAMTGVSTAIAVACGQSHTAMVISSGAVFTAGSNSAGQLGDGTTTTRSTVVNVIGVTTAKAVAGGTSTHTMILLSNGTVRTCGLNSQGQLGDNTTSTRSTTVQVLNIPFTKTSNLILTANTLSVPQLNLGVTNPSFQLDLSLDTARKLTTSSWTTGSDEALKTNIELADLDRCVDIVSKLDLKYFKWEIPSDDSHSLGWIAQDVEQIFPKAVRVAEAHGIPDFKNLDTDQIIKVMWGALKKLRVDLKAKRLSQM
jgi:alpha-tubulin suppressor-like RCC1 family protein